ncbi:MAG: carboxymuconolactone decarboxylase family protein [Armatimonadota bacterium]
MHMTREQVYEDIRNTLGAVPEFFTHLPDATIEHDWEAFKAWQLNDTTLTCKQKELIGLAVASQMQCPYCEFYHREVAKFLGATEDELNEAGRVGMQTAGWSTWIASTGESLEQFQQETLAAIEFMRQQGQQRAA